MRPETQWKARCYAFRAFQRRGGVVFGGPVRRRGPPTVNSARFSNRRRRTLGDYPTDDRPSLQVDNVQTRLRCASRARARTRCGPSVATARLVIAVVSAARRHPRRASAPTLCCRTLVPSRSNEPQQLKGLLNTLTTRDALRRPRRPLAYQ
jgi:hypothetical protein